MGDEGASKMGVSGVWNFIRGHVGRLPFMPIVLVPDGLLDMGHGKDIDQLGKMHKQLGHVISLEVLVSTPTPFFLGFVFCVAKPWLFEEL
jgi:hypothetical protein